MPMKKVTDVGELSNRRLVQYATQVVKARGIENKRDFKLLEPEIDGELARRHLRTEVVLPEASL